jgi:hypothetical protein
MVAVLTPEQGSGYERVRVTESVLHGHLFPHLALASGANELPVEGVEALLLGRQLVGVTFNGFPA